MCVGGLCGPIECLCELALRSAPTCLLFEDPRAQNAVFFRNPTYCVRGSSKPAYCLRGSSEPAYCVLGSWLDERYGLAEMGPARKWVEWVVGWLRWCASQQREVLMRALTHNLMLLVKG